MKETYEQIKYRGMFINIYQDEDAEDPRSFDNMGKMICFHRRYTLGDHKESKEYSDPQDFFLSLANLTDEQLEWAENNTVNSEELRDHLMSKAEKRSFILPLYLYDHSGITMNTSGFSCQWDSGQVGYIYVSREDALKNYGWKRFTKDRIKRVYEHLRSEVETYDQYLTGDVYGFSCSEDPQDDDGFDSCWGFFGDDWEKNGLFEHAKPAIDYHIKEAEEAKQKEIHNHFATLKAWIRNHVPL